MLNCRIMDLKVVTTKTIMKKLLVQYILTNPDVMRPELISTSESLDYPETPKIAKETVVKLPFFITSTIAKNKLTLI